MSNSSLPDNHLPAHTISVEPRWLVIARDDLPRHCYPSLLGKGLALMINGLAAPPLGHELSAHRTKILEE
jgi:hypothetical protein